MARIKYSGNNLFAAEGERHYTDSMRCSKETKQMIITKCAPILCNLEDCRDISHGVLLKKLALFLLEKKDAVTIPQSLRNKVMVDCLNEYFKYHPNKREDDITFIEMIEIMSTHYLESEPR